MYKEEAMPQTARRITRDDIEAGFVRFEKDLDETRKVLKESIEETARVLKESIEDTRKLKESIEDTRRLKDYVEETSRALNVSVGGLNNTMGNVTESMLVPSLVEKFEQLGYTFENMDRRRKLESDENEIITELDAFLENTTHAIAVEVKTTLRHDDVDYHVKRMEKIRRHADQHNDKRQFLGAIWPPLLSTTTQGYTR
jgi:predicted RNase H-related nuclease YkuK (DUF458 family)